MEQKKKKGYGAGIVTGILATVLVSLLLLGGFRVITNTAGSYVSGKVTEKEVSKKPLFEAILEQKKGAKEKTNESIALAIMLIIVFSVIILFLVYG